MASRHNINEKRSTFWSHFLHRRESPQQPSTRQTPVHDQFSPSLAKQSSSYGSSSFSQLLIDSFDQDSPVFVETNPKGIQFNTASIDSSLEDSCDTEEMHQKLKEQWSAGSAERPASRQSLRGRKAISVSCPALDNGTTMTLAAVTVAEDAQLQVDTEDDGMLHKSMLNLSNTESATPPMSFLSTSSAAVGHASSGEVGSTFDSLRTASLLPEVNVQICINDVSVDNADDFLNSSGEDEDDLNIELIRRQKRRSSWCPEQERKKDEKEEKQKMLGINGRSQSLSSLEGQDDSDDEDDVAMMTTHVTPKSLVTPLCPESSQEDQSDCAGSSDMYSALLQDPCDLRKHGTRQFLLLNGSQNIDGQHTTSYVPLNHERVDIIEGNRTILQVSYDQLKDYESNSGILKEDNICYDSSSQSVSLSGSIPCDDCSDQPQVERSSSQSEIFLQKEEKTRRRSSVFSRISNSYRQNKKGIKGSKLNKNLHQFVSVSVSNSISCDVCGKCLSNKPARQCENCTINVHESNCIDQTTSCQKSIRLLSQSNTIVEVDHDPDHDQTTESENSAEGQQLCKDESSPAKKESTRGEDDGGNDGVDSAVNVPSQLSLLQFASHSSESLDEFSLSFGDSDEEMESRLREDLAEAWSVTVDKKTLKKMTAKDIKRQDHIWELIQTEKNHFKTLNIMQKVFAEGMMREVGMTKETVEQIFPRLEELLKTHSSFLKCLFQRQSLRADRSIECLGDLLVQHLQGDTGNQMKAAYGEFCSKQSEAISFYKELRRTDRKFQVFLEKCSHRNICRRLGVDEWVLLVTQRLTKYPLLIEPIIKTTIDALEKEQLNKALCLVKDIISSVNKQVDNYIKHRRLCDIINRLDQKSWTMYRGSKFKKFELLLSERKLCHEGYIKLRSAREKAFEVLAVVLTDIMIFFTESNQRYYFFNQDRKSSVVSLSKLVVREKDDTKDNRGFYLLITSDEPEMYELICKSTEERSQWIALLRDAIFKCQQDGDIVSQLSYSPDLKPSKIQQLLGLLQEKDEKIITFCNEKTQIALEILELISRHDLQRPALEDTESIDASQLLALILQLESRLLLAVKQVNLLSGQSNESYSFLDCNNAHLPRRAETFSGFENKDKDFIVRKRNASGYSQHNGKCIPSECQTLTSEDQFSGTKAQRRASLINASSPVELNKANNNSNGDKSNRRMSVNLLPNMLNKLHREKESSRQPAGHQTTGRFDETLVPHVSVLADWFSTLVTDQCESLAQIAVHVRSLIIFLTKQSTEIQSIRSQLNGTSQNISQLSRDNDRWQSDRRGIGFQHEKQLEELRTLQGEVGKQKKELLKLREVQQAEFQSERQSLLKIQEDIDRQKSEIKVQKEELQRQKDALQRQIDFFEEQRLKAAKSVSSLSQHVEHLDSKSYHFIGQPGIVAEAIQKPEYRDEMHSVQDVRAKLAGSGIYSGTLSSKDGMRSNEVKQSQQGTTGRRLVSSSNDSGTAGRSRTSDVQQMLPMRLSMSGGSTTNSNSGSSNMGCGLITTLLSTKDLLSLTEKSHGSLRNSQSLSEKPSTGNSNKFLEGAATVLNQNVSRSQPHINASMLKSVIPSHVTANMLPMRLAEKSKSTPTSTHNSPTRSFLKIQKKELASSLSSVSSGSEKLMQNKQTKEESDIIFF